jgi:hypothetical protein
MFWEAAARKKRRSQVAEKEESLVLHGSSFGRRNGWWSLGQLHRGVLPFPVLVLSFGRMTLAPDRSWNRGIHKKTKRDVMIEPNDFWAHSYALLVAKRLFVIVFALFVSFFYKRKFTFAGIPAFVSSTRLFLCVLCALSVRLFPKIWTIQSRNDSASDELSSYRRIPFGIYGVLADWSCIVARSHTRSVRFSAAYGGDCILKLGGLHRPECTATP